ncbi:MAG: cytochrome c peroxidase [Candidatus Kapaibacteriota bacterium]
MFDIRRILFLFAIVLILVSCGGKKEGEVKKLSEADEQELLTKASSIFGVLPNKMPGSENDSPELIELGKKLYFETKLSVNNTMSCNTCHDINNLAGVDNKPTSPGAIEGKIGTRNTPTVFNAGFQFAQFWDGRAADLKEQAKGPILNPVEMAMPNEKEVEKVISSIPEYQEMFQKAFPNEKKPITFDNIAHAIAAFERTLVSKSRFDNWIAGDKNALTDEEKVGLKNFIEVGCITCHTGPLFGGNLYQKMGLVKPYYNTKDLGRYEVTKQESDKFMFKVAMLRNVELTYPYFHDGSAKTLEEAVKIMADINLGKQLTDEQLRSIVTFLKALTDPNLVKKVARN